MDNETREVLQQILTKVSSLDSKVSSLDYTVSSLESGQQELKQNISAFEQKLKAGENRMISKINENRNEIMTYLESKIQKDIKQIADGHLTLVEKMDRMDNKLDHMQADIDEIKSTVTAHEIIITNKYKMA